MSNAWDETKNAVGNAVDRTKNAVGNAMDRAADALDTDEEEELTETTRTTTVRPIVRAYDDRGTTVDPDQPIIAARHAPADVTSTAPAVTAPPRYYAPTEGREHMSALFVDHDDAQRAVNQLESLGVPLSDISVLYRDPESGNRLVTEDVETGSKAGEGAGTGTMIGGTIGAILGALAAVATSIAIPGIGVIVAGPIAGALAGAGAGGLTGGILGALIGAGIPEEHARAYEQGLNRGGAVVVADVPDHLSGKAHNILQGPSY